MASIKITDIKIRERVRKDLGDIEGLAASVSQHGLIQPIVLDQDNFLVAGGRRLAAHMHLGLTEIEYIRREDLDVIEAKELELDENIRRKDLSWQEEVKAVRTLYNSRQDRLGKRGSNPLQEGAGYGVVDAARELDRSIGSISMDKTLADGLDKYPELEKEKNKSAAFKRLRRLEETAYRVELARRNTEVAEVREPTPGDDASDDATTGTVRQPIRKVGWKGRGLIYHADARDVLRMYQENSIDCIVTDPPFGINLFKEGQATGDARLAANQGTMYDDDPQTIMNMLDEVFMHAAKLLKPNGHAYVFFHMTRYEPTFLMLRKHFGTCESTPILWIKNTPGIGDPNRSWVYAYEPCFFINRGRAMATPQAFNYLKYDTVQKNKIHPTEKPVQLLRHLISASCVKGEVVLDPFAGSGSTLVAADQVGCRFIGVEQHEPFFRSTVDRVAEDLALEKKEETEAA